MERWVLLRKGADYQAIGKKFHIAPRIACLIRNREVIGDEAIDQYLNGTIADLHDGMLMKGMDQAVDILMEKIREGARIRVIGDYDIDGVNATYILLEALEGLRGEVDMDIPDRITDGYGLNRNLIDRAFDDGIDTIITCDNGIAAESEIAYAKEMGMTVIVTDHHEVPYTDEGEERIYHLPPADAVVDPKQPGCEYPFKGLCGAAVAYKCMECLYEAMGEDSTDLDYLLEPVGIATIGDVMDLTDENRIFVKQALEMMGHSSNPGLRALMQCTGVPIDQVRAYHVGFVLGPCINAGGRLDTAKRSLELLLERDEVKASALAGELVELNESRKYMTQQETQKALEQIEKEGREKDKVLVVYLPECHESLAGIIAGRIREAYQRPVFVLTRGEEGVKGSGRSIEAYSMFDKMTEVAELFTKYGGHPMAAGLSMREEDIDKLREQLNQKAELSEEDMAEVVRLDAVLPMSYFTVDTIRQLSVLEPCGKSNTKPVFADRNIKVTRASIVGVNRNVLKLHLLDSKGNPVAGVYFGEVEKFLTFLSEKFGSEEVDAAMHGKENSIQFAAVYEPAVDTYSGRESVQAIIRRFR